MKFTDWVYRDRGDTYSRIFAVNTGARYEVQRAAAPPLRCMTRFISLIQYPTSVSSRDEVPPNALAERLGGGTSTNFRIRITFETPTIQIRGLNPAKSDSNQRLGRL